MFEVVGLELLFFFTIWLALMRYRLYVRELLYSKIDYCKFVDLSQLDTSKVRDMSIMFKDYETLDLSKYKIKQSEVM